MRRSRLFGAMLLVLAGAATPLAAFELGDLLRTPSQRAAARHAAGEHEALVDAAPDAEWEGIGRYATGDHAGAVASFERALRALGEERDETPGTAAARDRLRYNLATAAARAGQLEQALSLYDAVLARDPAHADARRNREIVRELLALEREEAAARGAAEDATGTGEEARGAGDEGRRRADGGREERTPDGGGGESGSGRDERPDEGRAARAALEAEDGDASRDGRAEDAPSSQRPPARAAAEEADAVDGDTPSEREQTVEQWLRRIDDDPEGLLRRRLQRTHRDDYPDVGDGAEPW